MSIGERVSQRLDALGMSQSELARRVGIAQSTVNTLINRNKVGSKHLHRIARELQTTPEFLNEETDDCAEGFTPKPALPEVAEDLGLVPIKALDLAYGMGATYLDAPITEEVRYFPREWLRQFTKAPPEQLAWVQGVGDSMMPTLLDSDTLLLDLSRKSLTMSDQIWALAYCGLGMVKRLRPTPDGGLRLLSDNPAVPEETSHDGEVQLIGRVVAFTRKL